MIRNRKAGIGIFLALTMVMSVFAMGFAGAAPADELNYDGDNAAPNPQFTIDSFTVARHPASQGLSDDAMAGIYDDSGDWIDDPIFSVNASSPEAGVNENPYTFSPGHIDDEDFGVFPRTGTNDDGDQLASALTASEWSSSGANSSKLTIEDTEVAEGADAVRIYTDGSMATDDVATASYANWTSELDTDEEKRVLQVAADVDTLDAGTIVYINATDETGDTKHITVDPSGNASKEDVLADATGDSYVTQVKLADLSTTGSDFDNIESVDISIQDGDADMSFSWVDLESKGKDKLGVETVDSDGDGNYDETNELYQAQGSISVNSMETVGGEFSDATFNDVSFPATAPASQLSGDEGEEGVYRHQFDSAEAYPAYDAVLNVSYRMELPGYIDASYSGVTLEIADQTWNGDRFTKFSYSEGVSEDTNFSDVTLTDISGNLGNAGDAATIDDTVQIDTGYVVTAHVKMTSDEKTGVLASGGAPPPEETGGGGPLSGIWNFVSSIPGMLVTAGGTLLGFNWLRNRG